MSPALFSPTTSSDWNSSRLQGCSGIYRYCRTANIRVQEIFRIFVNFHGFPRILPGYTIINKGSHLSSYPNYCITRQYSRAGNLRESVEIRENRKSFLNANLCCSTVYTTVFFFSLRLAFLYMQCIFCVKQYDYSSGSTWVQLQKMYLPLKAHEINSACNVIFVSPSFSAPLKLRDVSLNSNWIMGHVTINGDNRPQLMSSLLEKWGSIACSRQVRGLVALFPNPTPSTPTPLSIISCIFQGT